MTESTEERQRREGKEADNAAKNAQVLFRVLALNGNTPSGQRITLKDAARRCNLTVTAVYWAAEHLASSDRQWLEIWPKPTGIVEAIAYSASSKDHLEVRITEAGVAHWKDEISMRYQTKQFEDVDNVIWRARWGFRVAVVALALSLVTLGIKLSEWLRPGHTEPPLPTAQEAPDASTMSAPSHLPTTSPSISTSAPPSDTLAGTRSHGGRGGVTPDAKPNPKFAKKAPG